MDIKLVENSLAAMCGFEDGVPDMYFPFVEAALAWAQSVIKDEADENDPRVIQLAAAKAAVGIMCSGEIGGVTSFSAGDVSLTENGRGVERALALLNLAMKDCAGLIQNGGFAFMGA